ncbi:RagB/SusD family nutrient uptake outer membrane protein [Butyricimonas hominis]|uniref:RagB/SusD family nutrient uptake outer membrane protein n=1 Tax=Butyricimonas hominis TaxID=2763032 RepID=A0ABR7D4F2_9BACT|nr:RagB/SusD family nutrient uptake outer membrane protein [Butyricimonas hominis]MBC5622838.1 RagB/SusD family nutrient uptake outer membrane protein [Butyricimonas hominis]
MKKILIVLFAGAIAACSDFLEPKSQSEYIPKEATALNEMLLGEAYPMLSGGDNAKSLLDIVSILDDDVMCTDTPGVINSSVTESNASEFILLRALFSWQPDVCVVAENYESPLKCWGNYYTYILGANAALDYVDGVSGTEDEKNIVKAQALALRGFYYFYLVNIWGESYSQNKAGLGVPLKLTSGLEKRDISRNTVEEVYERILKDLNEAERLYGELPESLRFKKDYRTSLPMVQLLKSRVYLYMEDWKNAAIYAKKVIEDWDFALTDLNNLPKDSYYNFISMDCTEAIWVFGSIAEYMTYLDVNVYIDDPMDDEEHISVKFFNASDKLLKLYTDGDLRKANYVLHERYNDSWGNQYEGNYLAVGKFAINPDHNVAARSGFAHAFRLPEAYLNLAEAAAMDKDDETALWALNELRKMRFAKEKYKSVSGLSGEVLVERIRLERRLELCFEGHRWFDLKRYGTTQVEHQWKMEGKLVQTYLLPENDPFYAFPLSRDVLEQNKSLEQNKLPNPR